MTHRTDVSPQAEPDDIPCDGSAKTCPTSCIPHIRLPTHPAARARIDPRRFSARVQHLLSAALRRDGLNTGLFAALMVTGFSEGLTQQDLADRLGLTEVNVSQLLDRRESANLVRRVPEGRAYALHLTPPCLELLGQVIPEQERLIADQFTFLTSPSRSPFTASPAA